MKKWNWRRQRTSLCLLWRGIPLEIFRQLIRCSRLGKLLRQKTCLKILETKVFELMARTDDRRNVARGVKQSTSLAQTERELSRVAPVNDTEKLEDSYERADKQRQFQQKQITSPRLPRLAITPTFYFSFRSGESTFCFIVRCKSHLSARLISFRLFAASNFVFGRFAISLRFNLSSCCCSFYGSGTLGTCTIS